MAEVPKIYGNVVQVTRSPWEVNLHILRVIVPRTAKAGDTLNILEVAEEVAVVTLPLDVGKKLIEILKTMTAEGVVEVAEKEATDAR